uniref:Uncharacterized protein n=1 Tax=Chromera velia CCMP2878 TaxID=1169474 RepID=A0A0G4I914_9ALVE|eukprot:Cvel_12048.t1-p1 / transcript=Cvel_12048.t1 / gene=Cvel_12048 / organism=Chromera_velia_CCMP2878 / gene_product=hypothetical protein / transcript_product=hypothetical protein / location=Cvel_scaffold774:38577-39388(-) / protein_length=170 / sequence_SO=supercontig / SO=protein_coding / is_pseudo=false
MLAHNGSLGDDEAGCVKLSRLLTRRRALVYEMEKRAVAIQTLEEEIDRISERKKIEGRERAVNYILQAMEEVGLLGWLRSGTEGGVGKRYEGVFWGGKERSPVSVTNRSRQGGGRWTGRHFRKARKGTCRWPSGKRWGQRPPDLLETGTPKSQGGGLKGGERSNNLEGGT